MFPLLVVLFITVPILEIFVIIQVGQAIGPWWTILILVADSILGSILMRSQGRAVWRRFNDTLAAGRPPAREVIDGVLVIFGGALLLTPGFTTDLVGVLLLLPPSRAVVRRLLVQRFAHRVVVSGAGAFASRGAGRVSYPRDDFDVDGTATDVDDPPRRLP